jgi:hypothetical protein
VAPITQTHALGAMPSHSDRKACTIVGCDDIGLCGAATAKDALALIEKDHSRLVITGLGPDLAYTLAAGPKLLLLEICDRKLLVVALHRLRETPGNQRFA